MKPRYFRSGEAEAPKRFAEASQLGLSRRRYIRGDPGQRTIDDGLPEDRERQPVDLGRGLEEMAEDHHPGEVGPGVP